jgi:hypothetical protein
VRPRSYLLIALFAFFVAVTGSDLFARLSIGHLSLPGAVREHVEWVGATFIGVLLLLAPFMVVAIIGAITNERARTRSAVTLFVVALLALLYFYFGAFQAAEEAMLGEQWTAATLSIGLLPFFIGIPIVLLTAVAAALAVGFDRQPSTQANSKPENS